MPDSMPAPDAQPALEQPTTKNTQSGNAAGSPPEPQSDHEPSWFSALDKAFEEAESSEKSPLESESQGESESEPEDKSGSPEEQDSEDKADGETKSMTANAGARFKEIKAEAKAARARVAELEAKLSELESAKSSDSADPEALKSALSEKESKISEYERELAISRFEATQEYKESVVAPMAAILGVVEDLAKEYEISEKAILSVLEEPSHKRQGELISDLASNFSERDRFSLYQLGDDYAAVIEQRDTLRDRASEALAAREKAAQMQEANKFNESRKAWGNSVKSVWDTFKSKVPLPDSPEERAKFESEVMSQVSNVNFDKLSNDHKAFAAYSGAVLPEVLKRNKSLSSEVSELKTALKKYQKATPGAGAGSDSKPKDIDSTVSFLDSIEKHFGT
jgi:hypothetical protein